MRDDPAITNTNADTAKKKQEMVEKEMVGGYKIKVAMEPKGSPKTVKLKDADCSSR